MGKFVCTNILYQIGLVKHLTSQGELKSESFCGCGLILLMLRRVNVNVSHLRLMRYYQQLRTDYQVVN